MNAGKSSDTAMVLPSLVTKALLASNVASSVAMPRISSTSSISGTGFMKWIPMKRSGRSVEDASRVIEIDEVLVARIASDFNDEQSSPKILRLTSSFSVAVSITRSQPENASYFSAGLMRASAFLRSSSLIAFLPTWRAMLPLMVAIPALIRSADRSLRRTE